MSSGEGALDGYHKETASMIEGKRVREYIPWNTLLSTRVTSQTFVRDVSGNLARYRSHLTALVSSILHPQV
jgi:hypothetical protein